MGVILSKLFIDVESIPQTGFGMVGKGGGCDVDTTPFPVRRVQLHSIQGSKLDFGWKRTAHIHRCGEIAAHAFAKEIAALPELPNLYDYLYLIYTGKMTSAQFDALLARMRAMLGADEGKDTI